MIEGCHRRCIDKEYSSHLLCSLFNVKQQNKLCDTTIYARDGQLRAHGVVLLASGCQAFMSLALDTDAVHHHVHCFGGEKMSSVLLFLELLYTGCVKFDDIQRARVLYRLCRDYGMKRALPEMESSMKILEEEEEKRKNMKDSQKKQETGLHILQDQQVLTNKELGIMKELGHPDIPKTVSNLSDPPHSVLHTMTSNSTSLLQSFQSAMQNALPQKSYLNVSSQPLSKTEGQNLIHTQTERSTQQHLLYVQNAAVSHCQQPSILQHSQQYSTNGRNLLPRQHETIQYSQPQRHSSMTSALLPQQHSIDRQPQVQQHLGQQQHLTRRTNLIPQCDNITQTSQHALRNQEPWQHRQTDFTQEHDQHPLTVRELMQPSTTLNKLLHVSHNMQEGSVTFAGHCDLGLQGCAENVRTDIVSRHSLIPFSRGFQSSAHDFERKETSEPVSFTNLEEVQQLSNTQMDMETSLFLYQSQQSGCKQVIQDNLCHMQNAVTSESMSQSAVTSESMSQNAVTSASMSQSAVTSESMSQSAVTSESMSQSAVTSESMSQSTVTSESLSQSAVTSESMPQSAVTSDSLPQSAVTSESMSLSAVTFMNVSQNAITCKSMPQNIFTSDRSLQKVVRKQTTEVLRPNSDILICKDSVDSSMYDVSLTEKGRNRSSPLKTLPSFTCPEDVSMSETDNGANNPTNCDEKISFLKNDSCCENSENKRSETMPCPTSLQKSYEDLSTQSAKGFNRGKRKKRQI